MNKNVKFPARFFLVTFLFSWVIWTPLVLGSLGIIPVSEEFLSLVRVPVIMLGAFGPLAGALYDLRRREGKGSAKKFLHTFLDFRSGRRGYILPILIFGGSTFAAWYLPELCGEERLPMLLPSIWVFIPCLIFMLLVGGGQEEFGWRGYALPVLEEKFGIWYANIILGVIWALWHIPTWFITGTTQSHMNFGGFVLLMTGYSFIFSWIRKISGNRPFSGIYAHGLANAIIPVMPTFNMQDGVTQPRYWIWVTLTLMIGVVITAFRRKEHLSRSGQQ
ncbi:CPBP family intramembrane metalloprotease [bacterium]|nr:CPBP family intramembrane metalloprotease [bacterium]